jgi:parallel beta-helix repeat protein
MTKYPIPRKCLAIGIILLFVGTCIIPATAQETEKSQSTSRGNWLYVGGSGLGNYTRIQDAIDNASDGDTVFVYNGTYHEAIHIDKTLNIVGEDRDITYIDANFSNSAVIISHELVYLSGFTIIGKNCCVYITKGLYLIAIYDNNLSYNFGVMFEYPDKINLGDVIWYNIFYSNTIGILFAGSNNFIENNAFINNDVGLIVNGRHNQIRNNTCIHCRYSGIQLYNGSSRVEDNIFIGNDVGLQVWGSGNIIIGNHFEDNSLGIQLINASNTIVNQNNFINNQKHASFYVEKRSHGNNWDNNYWSGVFHFFDYKFIFGRIRIRIPWFSENPLYYYLQWINFDKQPAQEPYNSPGVI